MATKRDSTKTHLDAMAGHAGLYFVEFLYNGKWLIDSGPYQVWDEALDRLSLSKKSTPRFKFRVSKYARVED